MQSCAVSLCTRAWLQLKNYCLPGVRSSSKRDEAHLNMLVYSMGDEADDILKSFTFADGESDKSYETVKKKFDDHFIPQIYERALFNSHPQEPGESVDRFITALHTSAEHCNYEGIHDQMIRNRIVVGINTSSLSEKLQLDSKLTLAMAITQVRQAEAVKLQQPALRGTSKDTTVGSLQSKHHARSKQTPQKSKSDTRPKNSRPESRCSFSSKMPCQRCNLPQVQEDRSLQSCMQISGKSIKY